MNTSTFAALAAAFILAAAPAAANEYVERSTVVQVDEIALRAGSPLAAQAAHNAIVSAAEDVCTLSRASTRSLGERRLDRHCAAAAIDAALAASPYVSLRAYADALDAHARYQRHYGEPPEAAVAAARAAVRG